VTSKAVDWFAKGVEALEAIRAGRSMNSEIENDHFPPMNEIHAQRQWLGGFGSAWAELPGIGETKSLDGFLVAALEGQELLLKQLRSHAKSTKTRH